MIRGKVDMVLSFLMYIVNMITYLIYYSIRDFFRELADRRLIKYAEDKEGKYAAKTN